MKGEKGGFDIPPSDRQSSVRGNSSRVKGSAFLGNIFIYFLVFYCLQRLFYYRNVPGGVVNLGLFNGWLLIWYSVLLICVNFLVNLLLWFVNFGGVLWLSLIVV